MFNISFGSNYKINVGNNFPNEALDKIYNYEFKGGKIYSQFTDIEEAQKTHIYEKMNVCIPDEHDIDFETYLISKGINFKKETTKEAMDIENIKGRIELSKQQKARNYVLVEIDTNKFNELFKQNGISYISPNGTNGIGNRYKKFEEYLKTGQPITATDVNVNVFNGKLSTSINDGRHRFAYLRDMGMNKIPIAMSKESYQNAKEFGLI